MQPPLAIKWKRKTRKNQQVCQTFRAEIPVTLKFLLLSADASRKDVKVQSRFKMKDDERSVG